MSGSFRIAVGCDLDDFRLELDDMSDRGTREVSVVLQRDYRRSARAAMNRVAATCGHRATRRTKKESTMSKGQNTPPKTNKPKLSTKEKQAKKKEKAGKK